MMCKGLDMALAQPETSMYYALLGLAQRIGLREQTCVEIGCGSGSYSLLLAKMGVTQIPFLVDVSLMGLHVARKVFARFGVDCHLILADALALPLRTGDLDVALSGGVIEHFFGPSRHQVVKEHCRLANQVLCQVPLNSVPYWISRNTITVMSRGWPFGPEKPLSFRELRELFEQEGYLIKDSAYHDLLTAMLFLSASRFRGMAPLKRKTFINKLFRHDIVVYATKR